MSGNDPSAPPVSVKYIEVLEKGNPIMRDSSGRRPVQAIVGGSTKATEISFGGASVEVKDCFG